MTIHYVFRLTPAWPKSALLSHNIMGSPLVDLQTAVFKMFGDVEFSVVGPLTEQTQELLKSLDVPDDKLVPLGGNPFIDIKPGTMIFIFDAPAYLNETATLDILNVLSKNTESVYHLETENKRGLQIYALNGEYAQTFSVSEAIPMPRRDVMPVDTLVDFHNLREFIRKNIILRHVENGVFINNPDTVSIDNDVVIESNVTIEQGTVLLGHTKICGGSHIGPNAVIENSNIGNDCKIKNSTITLSTLENNVRVGPYAHIRPGSRLCNNSAAGSCVEINNSKIGEGSLVPHLSYVGDSEIGKHVNIGCGVAIANFNGVSKNMTQIGDNAFIGCNSVLIAPVSIGEGSVVGAGSAITGSVPPYALAIARSRQVNKEEWASGRTRNW